MILVSQSTRQILLYCHYKLTPSFRRREQRCIRIILDGANRGGQSARTIVPDIKCICFDERALSLSLSRSLSLPLFLLAQIEGPVGIVIARWNPVCFFIMSAPSTVYSPKLVSLHSLSISNESLFKNYNLLSLFIIYTLDSSLYSILLIFLF